MIKIQIVPAEKKDVQYSKGVPMFSGRSLAKHHAALAMNQKALSGVKVGRRQRKQ